MTHKTPMDVKFWRRVLKTKPDECWLWTGARSSVGGKACYGQFMHGRGNVIRAHRFSWEIHNGPIPEGKWVLHKCDNPKCVNPHHLFLGNNEINMADMNRKGRHGGPKGEQVFTAKLNPRKVRLIRKIVSSKRKNGTGYGIINRLAKRFGVGRENISAIIRGLTWKHVT